MQTCKPCGYRSRRMANFLQIGGLQEDSDLDDYGDNEYNDVWEVEPVSASNEASLVFADPRVFQREHNSQDCAQDACNGSFSDGSSQNLQSGTGGRRVSPTPEMDPMRTNQSSHEHFDVARVLVPKDNNCLFNAIAYLCGEAEKVELVEHDFRRSIAEDITNNPQKYSEVMLGKPLGQYCEWIQQSTNWGGENEICILCEQLNVEIEVILMGHTATSLTYGKSQTTQTPQYNRLCRIFLLYSGQHYDGLVAQVRDSVGGLIETIRRFPVGESEMSSLALAHGIHVFEDSHLVQHDHILASTLAMCDGTDSGSMGRRCSDSELMRSETLFGAALRLHDTGHQSDEAGRQHAYAPAQPASVPSGCYKETKKYLQDCMKSVSSDIRSQETAFAANSATMSQDELNSVMSLKLAQKLANEELKRVENCDQLPVLDPEIIAGIGLTFSWCTDQNKLLITRVVELSAANFAGVMIGDALLQINDRPVTNFFDVKRCLGPCGSAVHCVLERCFTIPGPHGLNQILKQCTLSLIREIKASKRADVQHDIRHCAMQGVQKISSRVLHQHLLSTRAHSAATLATQASPATPQAQESDFLQESRDLVYSGSILEIKLEYYNDNKESLVGRIAQTLFPSSTAAPEEKWRQANVRLTRDAMLVVDQSPIGLFEILCAAPVPDASADLRELQMLNLERQSVKSSDFTANMREENSRCLEIFAHTGIK